MEAGFVAELVMPSSLGDTAMPRASVEPVAQRMAAVPEVTLQKAGVEPSVAATPSPVIVRPATPGKPQVPEAVVASPVYLPAPPVQAPVIVSRAPSSARPVRSPVAAAPARSFAWKMPRPIVNMAWSRRTSVKPIALRIKTTSAALLETSVTRIKHKLDELKAVEKLQHIAESSMHWLRQPMRPAHRGPVGTRHKP